MLFTARGGVTAKETSPAFSWSKHAYNRAADLWQTWLPPKAVDSLKKGKQIFKISTLSFVLENYHLVIFLLFQNFI